MNSEEIRAENLELLRQYLDHYRHIETERYWFMSVFAVVIGVVLGLMFKTDPTIDPNSKSWIFYFIFALTNIGFLINIRWAQTLGLLSDQINKIGKGKVKFEVPHYGIFWIARTRYLFPFFYLLIIVGTIIRAENIFLYIIFGIIFISIIFSLLIPLILANTKKI
jgi:hypothetical protein